MAKVLLLHAKDALDAEDVRLGDEPILNELLQSIINSQNGQIMKVRTHCHRHSVSFVFDLISLFCSLAFFASSAHTITVIAS